MVGERSVGEDTAYRIVTMTGTPVAGIDRRPDTPAVDIPSFLRMYPPFDELSDERLTSAVEHTHIEFYGGEHIILQAGGEPARFLYVVRTGAVELVDEEHVIDLLSEGEVFGHPSLLSGMSPVVSVRALEDCICYLIDREIAEEILGTHSGLAFLSSTLRRRVVRALDGIDPSAVDPWQTPVRTLVWRPPVLAAVTSSIREAAELMTRERVSALLIERMDGFGILTDRDLRSRVLAKGRSPDTVISDVMTTPVVTVLGETMVAEVIALMFERGVHHVPVVDGSGAVIGIVTDSDLMGLEQRTPFALKADIERATDADAVTAAARRLPETVCALVEANVDPIEVGHVIAVTIDSLTRRILELGIRKIGDPPCPWSWLALGSEARSEQALATDQDNALVLDLGDTPLGAVDPYFERLATFVNERLEQAGIPRCRAGVIASNSEWRDTVLEWEFRFGRWMRDPSRMGGAFSGIAFDYRPVAGPLEVQPILDAVIRRAPQEPEFIRHLGRLAIGTRPPTGFTKDAVVESRGKSTRTLDVKHGGITIITNIARVRAVMAGLTENRTLRRLHEVAIAGGMREEQRQGLEEAFRLLWQIRLEHQTRQVRAGIAPDDLVEPGSLGPLARQGLKEAFRMIEREQDALAAELGLRR
jgi:CBS domain-containing protein